MGVIVDTSVWVDLARGRLEPAQTVARIGNDRVFMAPMILAELEYSLHATEASGVKTRRIGALARLRRKPCLIMDRTTGEVFSRLVSDLERRGRAPGRRLHDVWIAALALQHGFSILTRTPQDFADLPGVKVIEV